MVSDENKCKRERREPRLETVASLSLPPPPPTPKFKKKSTPKPKGKHDEMAINKTNRPAHPRTYRTIHMTVKERIGNYHESIALQTPFH